MVIALWKLHVTVAQLLYVKSDFMEMEAPVHAPNLSVKTGGVDLDSQPHMLELCGAFCRVAASPHKGCFTYERAVLKGVCRLPP